MTNAYRYGNAESGFEAFCYKPEAGPLETIPEIRDKSVILPNTQVHSGRVVERSLFTVASVMEGIPYLSPAEPADGTYLGSEDLFLVRTAGCPLLVLAAAHSLGVCHAGLKSIIDYRRIAGGEAPKRDAGVLEQFARLYADCGIALHEVSVHVLFGSEAREFRYPLDHPVYGARNKKLYREFEQRFPGDRIMDEATGAIDAALLASCVAVELGFGRVEVHAPISATNGFATSAAERARNYVGVARV